MDRRVQVLCHASRTEPVAGPNFDLPVGELQRGCLGRQARSNSHGGSERRRPLAEFVVHSDFYEMEILLDVHRRRSVERIPDRRRPIAQADIVVLELSGPVRRERIFNTGACGPARSDFISCEFEQRTTTGHLIFLKCQSATALQVEQALTEGDADPTGQCADTIDPRVAPKNSNQADRVAVQIRPARIGFKPEHCAADLIVGADLATGDEFIDISRRGKDRTAEEGRRIRPCLGAPTSSGMHDGIQARPIPCDGGCFQRQGNGRGRRIG